MKKHLWIIEIAIVFILYAFVFTVGIDYLEPLIPIIQDLIYGD